MRSRKLMQSVKPFVSAIAVIAIAAVLVFTIYFTQLSMQWATFLAGVLVAAVLAEAARVSRAEWIFMRRTAQLSSVKTKLERETRLRKSVEAELAASKPRLNLIDEVLAIMVMFVDAGGRCRYHNRASREWLQLRPEQIDGVHLNQILGARVYQEITPYIRQALDGHIAKYERTQQMANGAIYKLAVTHVPQFADSGKVAGFYMLIDDVTEHGDVVIEVPEQDAAASQALFVDSFAEEVTGHREASAEIVAAIEKNEFALFYQQIAPLALNPDGAEYHEILVRLMEEEEGMMPPGAFFPLAEKHGMMPYLDRWVVQHVTERIAIQVQQKTWREGSVFFVNLSEATIGDRGFPDYLGVTLLQYGVPGAALCFEIPHSELVARGAEVAAFARRISQSGGQVALSGFGRDQAMFDRIRGFQVEFLKIDGNIILHILNDPVALAKVVAINRVAKKIGVATIAEFVESDEIITRLREIGIDFVQGFGVAKPRPLGQ
ncbi:MAG: EAL domain-containing protein [Sideroxydans sp.]|nr:EAL domain-containing protein [Sideroxydans sp.]